MSMDWFSRSAIKKNIRHKINRLNDDDADHDDDDYYDDDGNSNVAEMYN